jgi:class 3 adenylate cyclase/tetratricopeptide (TPR) repeat protein
VASPSVQTVTVLITDLVGSTGLESRVGPAVADELRAEHFGLIRAVLDETGGREVKNTGDGLMLVFDSAMAAVACAAGIQQQFEFRNRSAAEQLIVKVGLSTGDATAEGDDYFGMPVIEAARLCDRCTGGQVLAKELVAHLASGRGHKFSSVGPLELKGLPEPLETVEVVWERRSEDRRLFPLPSRLQEAPPVGLVGRAEEGERLRELTALAVAGERRLALLSGEPGIGKTRLSTHAALEARSEQGAVVLYGHCDEEVTLPYGPWVEALAHYVEHAPEGVLREHAERYGGELGRILPGLRARVKGLSPARATDPDTERYLLWGAVIGLLRAASEREPLVVILDDLHSADKPSLLLLKHVLAEGQGIRALIIGTYRDSELHRGHPLVEVLADLHGVEGAQRMALGGLEQAEVVELMERAGGHELDEASQALSRELHRETDGNPFYTGELLRHLLESGAIYRQENGRFTVRGDVSELELPQSVREVLGRRVARLGEEEQRVLSIAAVIGREFDLELLLAVTAGDEDALLELLERAVAASVLNESAATPGRFYFAHALINHTLYEDLGNTRRARLHRRIAVALEAQLGEVPGARVGELAHHWAKATTAVDADKAVAYARMAGERALEELAPDEAVQWFERALELLGDRNDESLRCDLLIGLGEAQRQAAVPAYRETLLGASRIASELADGERAAAAALANSRGQTSTWGQVDQERVSAIERALELDEDPNRRAQLLSLQALELLYEHDHHHRWALAEQALALAREVDDPRTTARVLRDWFFVFTVPEELQSRLEHLDELLKSADAAGDPALEFWAARQELDPRAEAGELERADAALQRMAALAERVGDPTIRWTCAYHAGCLALLRGNLAAAERNAKQALRIGRDAGEPDAFMLYAAEIGIVRLIQGRVSDVVALEQSVHANPLIAAWKASLAWTLCWLGRTEDAAAIVAEAARDRFEHVPCDSTRSATFALYAEAAAQARDLDAAAILYELIEPWADQIVWSGTVTYGLARAYLGMLAATLGWDERADEHFKIACERQEQAGMLVWAARARLGWAEALSERGETERAREHAARALELSREHGYGIFEPRAAAIVGAGARAGA